jgi:hypothetical protein
MAPRERKPALAALAVLLILLGALGATVMVMRAGDKISVVEITANVAAGEAIPESALHEVMLSDSSDVDFVRWNQRGDLVKNYRAATNLVDGSLLVTSMVVESGQVLPPGKSIVGLSLKDGQFPDVIKEGSTVAAYRVGNDAARAQSSQTQTGSAPVDTQLISDKLIVRTKQKSSDGLGSGDTSITVLADTTVAGSLTVAASAGEVALVLVSDSKN